MLDFEPNCVGYAMHHFGLGENGNAKEKYVDPKDIFWTDYFTEVGTPEQADAVIVIENPDYEEAELAHIAVFDAQNKRIIRQRRGNGAKVETDTLENLLRICSDPRLDIIYVKLRT